MTVVPGGKVKWYDADKGFGFISGDEGDDVYLRAAALPEGTTRLRNGTRVEYSLAQGRRGAQAMNVQILDVPSVADAQLAKHRKAPEDMTVIVEDLIKVLDGVSTQLRRGRYPDKRTSTQVATLLRAVASDFDGA